MAGLLRALQELGAGVEELGAPGCPPVRIAAPAAVRPSVSVDASASSQQLSALLLAGARAPAGLTIEVRGELPSAPYVDLTVEALRRFGIDVTREENRFRVAGGPPRCERFLVDGDWSSASYPLAAAWLSGRGSRLEGVREDSPQGDRAILDLLAALDEPGPRRLHMGHCPDLVPTIAACALFASGETEVRDVAHLRIKESNRIDGLVSGLGRLGAAIEELEDGLRIRGGAALRPATLNPRNDHRLAMAFGLVSLRVPGIQVDDPHCVSKSYPDFWSMLERFR
jgi:3-phosphoshikimate 1-carboxyvinyltransferase